MKINEIVTESADTYFPPSISKGDIVKVGKFKNRKATVTGFEKDDHNQPVLKTTKGKHKLFKPRISKLEETVHNEQDLVDVGEWLDTTPANLNFEMVNEPTSKFLTQIKEMYGTYDEFPNDAHRTDEILRLLRDGHDPLPIYVESGDASLFVMEGRHRMVAFWLSGMKTLPVAYVKLKDKK